MENGAAAYRRFLNGDKEAFAEIVRLYKDGLIFFLNGYVNNFHTAEDLVQETFVRLYVKKPRFSGKSEFKTWLYSIARHTALDYLRKEKKVNAVPVEEAAAIPDDLPLPETLCDESEDRFRLYAAMQKLNPEYRRVLWLVYFEGEGIEGVSEIIGKSKNNTSVLLHRAKNALTKEFEKEGK